jgi:hypothetical protein
MAIKWRVMQSRLGHGVSVHMDNIDTEKKAESVRAKAAKSPKNSEDTLGYFIQSYEECRELYK